MYSTGRRYTSDRYTQQHLSAAAQRKQRTQPLPVVPVDQRIAFCLLQIDSARARGVNAAIYEEKLTTLLQEQASMAGTAASTAARREETDKSIISSIIHPAA